MLDWKLLLNDVRPKELDKSTEVIGASAGRLELERDYDRILFATPTRRLADKTQVFPMETHDSVRNRLTHSHEVSNFARGIGVRLAFDYPDKVFGKNHEELQVKRVVPPLLAAIGLAHDLGNPPFGHQGEVAIQQWFRERAKNENEEVSEDFLSFDGNAQTFRLLTRLQVLNDKYGLNLTVATLSALLKYPSIYGSGNRGGFKKYGVFQSEAEVIKQVWSVTGLSEGVRHPFAYVMESCDDIAYSVIDAEDTIKKGYASFYDLIDHLSECLDPIVKSVCEKALEQNTKFKKRGLSSQELNDASMTIFRVVAIAKMIESATETFVDKVGSMRDGSISSGFEIIKNSPAVVLCKKLKEFDYRHGFQNKAVLKLELEGNNQIRYMMDVLCEGGDSREDSGNPFARFVFGSISENYRSVYTDAGRTLPAKYHLICDALSGMTEKYLIKKNKDFKALRAE